MDKFKGLSVSRRNLLKLGAGAIGTGTLTAWLGSGAITTGIGSQLIAPEPALAENNITPDQALQKLIDGNKRFLAKKRENPNQSFARLEEVAKGQQPFAAILSCADSRVVPEIIFDQGIGDLFVVRVAGNVSTKEEVASQEFASLVLGAKVLMVIGHQSCGAVKAAIEAKKLPGSLDSLVAAIKPAVDASAKEKGDRLDNAIKANVKLQTQRLQESPIISKLIQEGKLKIVGGYYSLDTGEIQIIS